MIFSGLLHRGAMLKLSGHQDPQPHLRLCIKHKGEAIRQLREAIAAADAKAVSDELLMTILYLAANEDTCLSTKRDESPYTPPFTSLQHLDFYGSGCGELSSLGSPASVIK